jgi:hypothetical protein
MPHDAALFATSVRPRKTPAETAAAHAAVITATRNKFEASENQAERDYEVLTGQTPVKPTLTTFTPASVVMGTGTHSVVVAGTNFKAGMKILWDAQLLTPSGITATSCTVVATKSATAKTVNVVAINYDQTLEARSDAKTFSYTATLRADEEPPPEETAPVEEPAPVADKPTSADTKAAIIEWIMANDPNFTDAELQSLNKTQLLAIVDATNTAS